MLEATVISKGQVTLASELRKATGHSEKARVAFSIMPDRATVMWAKPCSRCPRRGRLTD